MSRGTYSEKNAVQCARVLVGYGRSPAVSTQFMVVSAEKYRIPAGCEHAFEQPEHSIIITDYDRSISLRAV